MSATNYQFSNFYAYGNFFGHVNWLWYIDAVLSAALLFHRDAKYQSIAIDFFKHFLFLINGNLTAASEKVTEGEKRKKWILLVE